jgi:hypothetical protein
MRLWMTSRIRDSCMPSGKSITGLTGIRTPSLVTLARYLLELVYHVKFDLPVVQMLVITTSSGSLNSPRKVVNNVSSDTLHEEP